ncbi:hypothetical protein BCR35DRAFT_331834 [Leucosporidium creatinivorum]|uniref:Extracellular mutant protein 11 C-terminal domain-containing protein n=1 Tax=Leucosporidium creatinivorum TaxID=106004 RepID=A0A1Y2FD51_9BASI|nr:hypothetical protein BCR35DRAFT_331834 [Leucosporidium creatinivorum]
MDREYEESENGGEYKRKAFGRRSPTPTGTYEEYRSPDSQPQDDTSHSYEQQQQRTRFGFANADHQQHKQYPYPSSDRRPYSNDPQHYLPAQQTHLDPLASVADLFPGAYPHLQQAQARLHAQHHSVASEIKWENCTLEEWKEGGDELAKKFGSLVARVVTLVAKKSSRTDGFKQQMQEQRDELQQQETKLEGTKEGLSKWAAVVGLGGSA